LAASPSDTAGPLDHRRPMVGSFFSGDRQLVVLYPVPFPQFSIRRSVCAKPSSMVTESISVCSTPAELAGHHEKHLAISARHVVKKSQQYLSRFRQIVMLGLRRCLVAPALW